MGELEMEDIKNLKNHSKKEKLFNNKKKTFSLLTCKKDEFKDWFDPL
jgi:hypothetical protein